MLLLVLNQRHLSRRAELHKCLDEVQVSPGHKPVEDKEGQSAS